MTTKNGATLEEALQILRELEPKLDALKDFPTVRSRVEALETLVEGFKGFSAKELTEAFDQMKATQKTLQNVIRNSRKGLYISGIEDQEFSVARAGLGRRYGWENVKGAKHEYEIMRQAAEKAVELGIYGKSTHAAGDEVAAGLFIPDQVIPDVIEAIYARGAFFAMDRESGDTRVTVLEGLVGGKVHIPRFEGGLVAYWIGEEDEYVESQAKVGEETLEPNKLGIMIRINEDLRDFVAYGFENMLRRDMGKRLALKMDWTIPYGTGGKMPRGILLNNKIKFYQAETGLTLDYDAAQAVSDWSGGELTFDGLDDMDGALEDDDIALDESAAWISHPRYFRRLRRSKIENYAGQTTAQPYLLGAPMIPNSRLADFIGMFGNTTQIKKNNLPAASIGGATTSIVQKFGDVFRANWSEVVVGRWMGLEFFDDAGKGLGFKHDQIFIKARMRADVGIRQPRAVVVCPDARIDN